MAAQIEAQDADQAAALILAAGGILEKTAGPLTLIAVVHRERYDDWSLPKGKQEPGETLQQTALREVREETGFAVRFYRFCRLRPLPARPPAQGGALLENGCRSRKPNSNPPRKCSACSGSLPPRPWPG
jgi:8-oxo-dGTP pyrophosphatase MutT (NUDIX family)